MYGWCKLLEENDKTMLIGYSWQSDDTCDGRLKYDKTTKEMKLEKLSISADKDDTSYFICPLRSRIRKGMVVGKRYMVATG